MAYTKEQQAKIKKSILTKIEIDGLSVRKVSELKGFPALSTIFLWLTKDDAFSEQYARACEARADKMADEILTICDATEEDIITDPETGNPITNHNVIQRDRLRVDTRKWLLSKLAPKKYGDKVDVTSGGDKIQNISTLGLPDYLEKTK